MLTDEEKAKLKTALIDALGIGMKGGVGLLLSKLGWEVAKVLDPDKED